MSQVTATELSQSDARVLRAIENMTPMPKELALQALAGEAFRKLRRVPKPVSDSFAFLVKLGFIGRTGKNYGITESGKQVLHGGVRSTFTRKPEVTATSKEIPMFGIEAISRELAGDNIAHVVVSVRHAEITRKQDEAREFYAQRNISQSNRNPWDARSYDPKVPDGGVCKKFFGNPVRFRDNDSVIYRYGQGQHISEGSNIWNDAVRIERSTKGRIARWQVLWSYVHDNEDRFDAKWENAPGLQGR